MQVIGYIKAINGAIFILKPNFKLHTVFRHLFTSPLRTTLPLKTFYSNIFFTQIHKIAYQMESRATWVILLYLYSR